MDDGGWVSELVALRSYAVMPSDNRTAADGCGYQSSLRDEIARELAELEDHAHDPVVKNRLSRARELITGGATLGRLLRASEGPLRDATRRTDRDNLAFDLRQLRQTLYGLAEGGFDER